MEFTAKARHIPISPYKLRPLADVVRGKNVMYALSLLGTAALKKVVPLKKVIESAVANAKYLKNIEASDLIIKEIRVDQGVIRKYYKPGAQGRSNPQRRRFCHMSLILESVFEREE